MPLSGNSPTSQSQTLRRTSTLKRRGLAQGCRMCVFGEFVHIAPQLQGQKPPKTIWGVNRRFQTKLAKSKNVHIIKTTALIPTKFCTVIKTTKCPSCVVSTHASLISDGGVFWG